MTDDTNSAPPDVEQARAELAATLAAIEAKLNVPKRARRALNRATDKVGDLRDENPIALAGIAAAAVATIGASVWLSIRLLKK